MVVCLFDKVKEIAESSNNPKSWQQGCRWERAVCDWEQTGAAPSDSIQCMKPHSQFNPKQEKKVPKQQHKTVSHRWEPAACSALKSASDDQVKRGRFNTCFCKVRYPAC